MSDYLRTSRGRPSVYASNRYLWRIGTTRVFTSRWGDGPAQYVPLPPTLTDTTPFPWNSGVGEELAAIRKARRGARRLVIRSRVRGTYKRMRGTPR